MVNADTIVALSSPPLHALNAESATTAIVRLSGPRALEFADAVFKCDAEFFGKARTQPVAGKPLTLRNLNQTTRWWRLPGTVTWNAHALRSHAYIMPAPKSYTREQVVELHVPGIKWVVDGVLAALVNAGARLALPGEFTRRAFSNGRITLEQADAVGGLIRATTRDEARAFAARLTSKTAAQRLALRAELEALLAQVELGLDFAHEDVVVITRADLGARLQKLCASAERAVLEAAPQIERNAALGLPRILLAGPTNAGKSMLFNALLGRDAALVSSQRHATRDRLEAVIEVNKLSALLIDTAGSGEAAAGATIIHAAQAASARELDGAEIVLLTLDSSAISTQEGAEELSAGLRASPPAGGAVVWTKCDLPRAAGTLSEEGLPFAQSFTVSAMTGVGLDALRAFLSAELERVHARTAQAHATTSAAVAAAAAECHAALRRTFEAWREELSEDVLAVELREALHALWRCEGLFARHDALTESALDLIFAQFCIGK